jgi:hypothetical protein
MRLAEALFSKPGGILTTIFRNTTSKVFEINVSR